MDYWKYLYNDLRECIPEIPVWLAVLVATFTWTIMSVLAWWLCDFRHFLDEMQIVLHKLRSRIIGGR